MELQIIARARNGFKEKFGIPRQTREDSLLLTRIVFEPAYRDANALRGITDFSHLWLVWEFSEVTAQRAANQVPHWQPTVRPPRLGGNTRMGVFATRSPFRPNPIGLSSVRLLRVEETASEGLVLVVSGADVLDGTPIYDIKPYLSFSDSHPDARNGFAEAPKDYRLPVVWTDDSLRAVADHKEEWEEILSQDPRPAYQDDPERIYGLIYNDMEVHFRIAEGHVEVINSKKCDRTE